MLLSTKHPADYNRPMVLNLCVNKLFQLHSPLEDPEGYN